MILHNRLPPPSAPAPLPLPAISFYFIEKQTFILLFLRQTCSDTKRVLCSTVYQLPRFFFPFSHSFITQQVWVWLPVERGEKDLL